MCVLIIPAAGSGVRFGADKPKQYIEVLGEPIIIRTIRAFENYPEISEIILAVNLEWKKYLEKYLVKYNIKKVSNIVPGGKERQDSIFNALSVIDKNSEIVLVHDAVRPFVSAEMISMSISNAKQYGAAVPGLIPQETIKQIDSNGNVIHTPPRDSLRTIQTPQAFRLDLLFRAYGRAYENKFYGTDDASIVEAYGKDVKVFYGSDTNIKITTPKDIALAEKIIKENKEFE